MPSVEKICARQWEDPDFRRKWLVGGLLASIPFVNLLYLGWMLRYARNLRSDGEVTLPEWEDWAELFLDGLRMAGLKAIYVGIPVLVGGLVTWLLRAVFFLVGLDFFALTLAFVPLMVGTWLGLSAWMVGIHAFLRRGQWQDLLAWQKMARLWVRSLPTLAVPTFALCGLFFVGWPLLGFAFLLGFAPYVAYSSAVLIQVPSAAKGARQF